MKILELEISNVRGVKQITIPANSGNVVVYGPNGTGKSAIVDSIDFLLTGKISRLTGEGSKGLSVKEHGPHVDYKDKLKEVIVRAKIKLNDTGQEIQIERKMTAPTTLKVSPATAEEEVKACLEIAKLGQHLLSRREILKYITAEAGKRATQVQSLLNLDQIEDLRSTFVTIQNNAEREFKSSESSLKIAESDTDAALSLPSFSIQACVNKINELRRILGGVDIAALTSKADIKNGVTPPGGLGKPGRLSTTQIQNYIAQARTLVGNKDEVVKQETELKKLLDEIARDVKLKKDLLHKRLLDLGINLLDDETNACPLCGREWTTGQFRDYLNERIRNAAVAQEKQKLIHEKSSAIKQKIDLLFNTLSQLVTAHEQFGVSVPTEEGTKGNTKNIALWANALLTPEEHHQSGKWPSVAIGTLFSEELIEREIIAPLEKAVQESGQKLSREQEAWNTLIRMELLWEQYQRALKSLQVSSRFKNRADAVSRAFGAARDSVLESIYGAVIGNFVNYYKCIHGEDEKGFSSKLRHEGPALIFEVDFYGRGVFPPHALHSEGHQDSMGVCLYFALNKHLAKDIMKLMVLDDVVMSIDRGHRRGVCNFLRQYFSDRQLVITTHDNAWARQLKTEGIVKQENMFHFVNWDIETGPIFELEKDFWKKIEEDLLKDDVPAAAHRLRWNAEYFFENVCDLLAAKISYKGNYHWELGDYAPAAISAYKDYLRRAKNIAQKSGQTEKHNELDGLDQKTSKIFSDSQIEQWIINENVHYNRWETFSKQDFTPVVEAFKGLFGLFFCDSCSNLVFLNYRNREPSSVTCNCGKFHWGLLEDGVGARKVKVAVSA